MRNEELGIMWTKIIFIYLVASFLVIGGCAPQASHQSQDDLLFVHRNSGEVMIVDEERRIVISYERGVSADISTIEQDFFISVRLDPEAGVARLFYGRETAEGIELLRDINTDGRWDIRSLPEAGSFFIWFDGAWVSVDGRPAKENGRLSARADSVVYQFLDGQWEIATVPAFLDP